MNSNMRKLRRRVYGIRSKTLRVSLICEIKFVFCYSLFLVPCYCFSKKIKEIGTSSLGLSEETIQSSYIDLDARLESPIERLAAINSI